MTNSILNPIIEAIAFALDEEFNGGDEQFTIYDDEVKQGLKEPCFFIACLNPAQRLFLGKRYFRENSFCIQYIPKAGNCKNEELNEVRDRLFCCLEYITVDGDLIRGTKMSGAPVDGVLNFLVSYDMFVYIQRSENAPSMEEFRQETSVKGNDENGK